MITIFIFMIGGLVLSWILWCIYMIFFNKIKIDKKYYKILTDGKEYKIKFPSGFVSSVNYESIDDAKEDIDWHYQSALKSIENKKKKWREVEQ